MKFSQFFTTGVVAIGLAALSLVGCGTGSNSTAGTGTAGEGSGKRLKIGVSIPAADHGWTAGVNWWANKAKDLYPEVDWTIVAAASPEKQIKDLENLGTQNLDGMVILATESAAITPAAKALKEKGTFIVNVDRGFLEPIADIFIEGDNKAFGRVSAEFMAKKLEGKGNIIILEGIPSTVNTDRVTAFREVMKQYPGIKILDSQSGQWNREKALNVTQGLLLKHKDVNAIWSSDDDMALGAEQALKEAGRTDVWQLGGAGMKDIVKRVMDRDPMYPADVTYPPSMIAMGMHLAVGALKDGKQKERAQFTPRHLLLDIEVVTPENAKDFYFPDSIY